MGFKHSLLLKYVFILCCVCMPRTIDLSVNRTINFSEKEKEKSAREREKAEKRESVCVCVYVSL